MKRCTIAAVCIVAASMVQALELSVAPTSMDWNSNGWVNVSISNLTPGAEVQIALVVDADQNHVLTDADVPIFSAMLSDGETAPWNAAYLLGDADGLTNGVVEARVSYHGVDGVMHTIGSYFWVAATNMAEPIATPFAVVQDTSTVWISGTVRRLEAPTEGITGARVQLGYFFASDGIEPAVWCDTNGDFRIFVPDGVDTSAVRGVMASGIGCVSAIFGPDGNWLSAYPFTAPLQIGANALTSALWVAAAYSDELYNVAGRVVVIDGDTTNPLPFALILAVPDDDSDWWSSMLSDEDGFFSGALPRDAPALLLLTKAANMQGLVSELVQLVVTQDMTNLLISCYPAESLVCGQITDADSGDPVPGAPFFAFNEELGVYALGYSMEDGVIEFSALAGTDYTAGALDEDVLRKLGYMEPESVAGFSAEAGTPYTNLVFALEPAYAVRGRVFDLQTNALPGGTVTAFASNSWNYVDDADANFEGAYELRLPTGEFRLEARDFAGYLPMVWSNHYSWEWSNGPVYDAVLVTAAMSGVDFYLPEASYIRGRVLGEGTPLTGVWVGAWINYQQVNGTQTADDGAYEIPVPGGTSYYVKADPPLESFWVPEYYNDVIGTEEMATPVYTDPSTPATNIDFDLTLGGRIEGQVFDADGFSPLPFSAFVEALDASTNWVNGTWSDTNTGAYAFAVPPGTYAVRMTAQGRLTRYYDGFFEYQQDMANPVTTAVESTRSNVNFVALPPSEVRGRVFSGANGVSGAVIHISYVLYTNTWAQYLLGSADSDVDGNYSVPVPPGSNFLARALPPGYTGFLKQWWSNAADVADATPFRVDPTSVLSGIDFELVAGMRIMGWVTDETGAGMTSVDVSAWYLVGNSPVWAGETPTESNGFYILSLPTSHVYFVRASRAWDISPESWWYPDVYYDGVFRLADAQPVWTNAGQIVSNVDFRLSPGYHITGLVLRAVGGLPLMSAEAQTFLGSVGSPLEVRETDTNGAFGFCVPTNVPIYLGAKATGYGPRYYSNVAFAAEAQGVQTSAYAIVPVIFQLAAWDEDLDGDGFNEYDEVQVVRTDPLSSNDYLRCAQVLRSGSDVTITWDSVLGVTYYLERTTNLSSGVWTAIAGPLNGTGGELSVTDTNAPPNAAYAIICPGSP